MDFRHLNRSAYCGISEWSYIYINSIIYYDYLIMTIWLYHNYWIEIYSDHLISLEWFPFWTAEQTSKIRCFERFAGWKSDHPKLGLPLEHEWEPAQAYMYACLCIFMWVWVIILSIEDSRYCRFLVLTITHSHLVFGSYRFRSSWSVWPSWVYAHLQWWKQCVLQVAKCWKLCSCGAQ
jgi:hypothetical protein